MANQSIIINELSFIDEVHRFFSLRNSSKILMVIKFFARHRKKKQIILNKRNEKGKILLPYDNSFFKSQILIYFTVFHWQLLLDFWKSHFLVFNYIFWEISLFRKQTKCISHTKIKKKKNSNKKKHNYFKIFLFTKLLTQIINN